MALEILGEVAAPTGAGMEILGEVDAPAGAGMEILGEAGPDPAALAARLAKRRMLLDEAARNQAEQDRFTPSKLALQTLLGAERGVNVDVPQQVGGVLAGLGKAFTRSDAPARPDIQAEDDRLFPSNVAPPVAAPQKPPNASLKLGRELMQGAEIIGKEYQALQDAVGGGPVAKTAGDVAASAQSMLPAAPLAMTPIALPAAAMIGAAQSFGGVFADAKRAYMDGGLTEDKAEQKALFPAAASGFSTAVITAAFGTSAATGGLEASWDAVKKGLAPFIAQVARSFAAEGTEEAIDQTVQSIVSKQTFRPGMTTGEALNEIAMAGLAGGVLTVPTSLIHGAIKNRPTPRTQADTMERLLRGRQPVPPAAPVAPVTPPAVPPSEPAAQVQGAKSDVLPPGAVTSSLAAELEAAIKGNQLAPQAAPTQPAPTVARPMPSKPALPEGAVLTQHTGPDGQPGLTVVVEPVTAEVWADHIAPKLGLEGSTLAEFEADQGPLWIRRQKLPGATEWTYGMYGTKERLLPTAPKPPVAVTDQGETAEDLQAELDAEIDGATPTPAPASTVASATPAAPATRIQPVPAEEMPAPATAKPKERLSRGSFAVPRRRDGIRDVLDAIQDLGGVRPPSTSNYKGGEYDGFREAFHGLARFLVSKDAAHRPDTLLGELATEDFRFETADDLYNAIDSAVRQREKLRNELTPEEKMTEFADAALSNEKKKKVQGNQRVDSDQLLVGDRFQVNGEWVEVTAIDPDTGEVTVHDGDKYGRQEIPPGAWVHPDKGSWTPAQGRYSLRGRPEADEGQGDLFGGDPKKDAAEIERQKQKDEAAKRQGDRLTGDTGTLGQADMFGGGDDLWAIRRSESGPVPPARAVTPDGLIAAVKRVAREGLPGVTFRAITAAERERMAARGIEAESFYLPSTREIVIVPENIPGALRALQIMREESAHDAFSQPETQSLFEQVANLFVTPSVEKRLNDMGYVRGKDQSEASYRRMLVDEHLSKLTRANKSVSKRIAMLARAWFKQTFPSSRMQLSDMEVARAFLAAVKDQRRAELRGGRVAVNAEGGEERQRMPFTPTDETRRLSFDGGELVGPAMFSLRAYHGTPHEVDKFSTSKIGTGEGFQAFGWGLYFSQNQEVAKTYAEKLSDRDSGNREGELDAIAKKEGLSVYWSDGTGRYRIAPIRNPGETSMAFYEKDIEKKASDELKKEVQRANSAVYGNEYTVELLVEDDELLDWDKRVSEQSNIVKASISAEFRGASFEYTKGRDVYKMLGDPQKASSRLAGRGIKGIRFFDAGSRLALGESEKTRNYVIFNDADIRITHKNGEPVTMEEAGERFSIAQSDGSASQTTNGVYEKLRAWQSKRLEWALAMENEAAALQRVVRHKSGAVDWKRSLKEDVDAIWAGEQARNDERRGLFDILNASGLNYGDIREHPVGDPAKMNGANAVKLQAQRYIKEVFGEQFLTMDEGTRFSLRQRDADPITRDDAGNVIPLSKRFNLENDDIRFSMSPRTRSTVLGEIEQLTQERIAAMRDNDVNLARQILAEIKKLQAEVPTLPPEGGQPRKPRETPEGSPTPPPGRQQVAMALGTAMHNTNTPAKQLGAFRKFLRSFATQVPELEIVGNQAARGRQVEEFLRNIRREAVNAAKAAEGKLLHVLEPLLKLPSADVNPELVNSYKAAGRVASRFESEYQAEIDRLHQQVAEAVDAGKPPGAITAKLDALLANPPKGLVEARKRMEILRQRMLDTGNPLFLMNQAVLLRDFRARVAVYSKGGSVFRLPFDLDVATVEAELSAVERAILASPHRAEIDEAMRRHYALMAEMSKALEDHGHLIPEGMKNRQYFPHLVVEKTARKLAGIAPITEEPFRPYMIEPTGSVKAIETDYISAVYRHVADVLMHNAHQDAVEKYLKPFDISDRLKANAKAMADARDQANPVDWRNLLPPGYVLYDASKKLPMRPDYVIDRGELARALGVTLAQSGDLGAMLRNMGVDLSISPEAIEQAFTMGEKERWAIPQAIADALNGIETRWKGEQQAQRNAVLRAMRGTVGMWKALKLFAPWNYIRYEYGNSGTDIIDKLIGADPGMRKFMWQSLKEVAGYLRGGEPTPLMQAAIQHGVMDAVTMMEMSNGLPEMKIDELLTRGEKIRQGATHALTGYFGLINLVTRGAANSTTEASRLRESWFRYAKFLADMDRLNRGNAPVYAGAYRGDVDALPTNEEKAAMISRRTFGDYGDLSVNGMWLRRNLVPFYSWTEVNFKYWANLFRNTTESLRLGDRAGAMDAARAGAVSAATTAAGLALRILIPYAIVQLWNTVGGRAAGAWDDDDLEATLSAEDRRRFHILAGKDDKGQTRVIYVTTALGDLMGWLGGDNAARLAAEVYRGEITLGQAVTDWGKQQPLTVANKLAQSIGPIIKGGYMIAARRDPFPDITDARRIGKDDLWWRVVGNLTDDDGVDLIRRLTDGKYLGKPGGEWIQQKVLQIRRRDPQQWSYYEIKEKAGDFIEARYGARRDPGEPADLVIRNFRKAIYRGDAEAALRFHGELVKLKYTAQRYELSILGQAPLSGLHATGIDKAKLQAEFVASLTPHQKQQLKLAEQYYARIAKGKGAGWKLFPSTGQPDASTVRSVLAGEK
jgi:hypothetical protein